MPEVSVVMPTRDRLHLMPRTLSCALAQEDVDLEVIVVDDGSIDGTAEYLASSRDPRVVVLAAGGRGVGNARNVGIGAARGEWVAFLDDDDLWAPRKLRHQLDGVRGSDAGMVFSGVLVVRPDLTVTKVFPPPPLEGLEREILAASPIPAGCSNVMVRRDVLRSVGGFDARLPVIEDWELWIRLVHATPVRSVEHADVAYVEHPGGISVTGMRDLDRSIELIRETHRDLAARYGCTPGEPLRYWQWLEGVARRSGDRRLAAGVLWRRGLRFRRPVDLARAATLLALGEGGMAAAGRLAGRVGRGAAADTAPPAPPWLRALQGAA